MKFTARYLTAVLRTITREVLSGMIAHAVLGQRNAPFWRKSIPCTHQAEKSLLKYRKSQMLISALGV